MRMLEEHKIIFEVVNDNDINLDPILNPVYVYKIGDSIEMSYHKEIEDSSFEETFLKFKVTDVKHLVNADWSEQTEVIYVTKEIS